MKTVDEIRRAAEAVNLGHRWQEIESLIRPSIRITYDESILPEALAVGASRIGGWPDLPPGMEWPMRQGIEEDGDEPVAPMLFLAQINLADVAPLDSQNLLPKSGILYFFACVWVNAITMGEGPLWAVRYFDGDQATLRPNLPAPPFPDGVDLNHYWSPLRNGDRYHYQPATFRFETQLTLPNMSNSLPRHPYLDSFDTTDEDEEPDYQELVACVTPKVHPAHQMLGWAGGDSKSSFAAETHDQVLLLQLDSNWSGSGMPSDFRWEFSGCGWFLIEPYALAARDFTHVDLIWASS